MANTKNIRKRGIWMITALSLLVLLILNVVQLQYHIEYVIISAYIALGIWFAVTLILNINNKQKNNKYPWHVDIACYIWSFILFCLSFRMGKGREVFKKTCSSTSSGVPYDFDSYQDDFHFNGDRIIPDIYIRKPGRNRGFCNHDAFNVCSDDDGHIINKTLNRCISYTI